MSVFAQIMIFFSASKIINKSIHIFIVAAGGLSYWLQNAEKDQKQSTKAKEKFGMSSFQDWKEWISGLLTS